MASKKHGLGRGLDALLAPTAPAAEAEAPTGVRELPLGDIDLNPDQPRKHIDPEKLQELRDSIVAHGVLQPILVVPNGRRYTIVAGERRYRAARAAGLKAIPALVRPLDARQVAEIALVENLQRDDLDPLEEAMGIRSLLETFHLTQEQVGERLGMSRPAVTNALRLLTLPPALQALVQQGTLSAGHARALLAVSDPARQGEIAHRVVAEGLSVRQCEALCAADPARKGAKKTAPAPATGDLLALQELAMQVYGTKVHIQGSLKRGKITLEYYSRADLDRIYALLQAQQTQEP